MTAINEVFHHPDAILDLKTKRDRHEPILVDDQIYQVKENACPKK